MDVVTSKLIEFKGFLSFLILHELKQKPLCGEDLAKKIGRRRGQDLTPGTIYPALQLLKKRKLVVYKRFGRKKVYSLREEGKEELERLYSLFAQYFWGLKGKITKQRIVTLRE